ncbi:MAG: hypothetical protein U5K75_02335 [Ahrensia sp.]|nr:hypothetical protein [Ahrensia sp.]
MTATAVHTLIDARPPSYLEQVENALVAALKEGVDGSIKVELSR